MTTALSRRRLPIALIVSALVAAGAIVMAYRSGTVTSWGVALAAFANVMVFYLLLRNLEPRASKTQG